MRKGSSPITPSSSEEGVGGGGATRQTMLARASTLRCNMTAPEQRLWLELRTSRFFGYKFRRQAVISHRIADFFCPAKELVVELDGDTHDREADLKRDAMLEDETGFATIRFTNEDVMRNLDGVLMALKQTLDGRSDRWAQRRPHHPPTPSSEEEGE